MLFRVPERLVNIDHYRRFNEFENAGNSRPKQRSGRSLGELRPLIRTPDGGGRVPVGCSPRSRPPSTGESKLPSRVSFQDHHEVFRFHETRHFRGKVRFVEASSAARPKS